MGTNMTTIEIDNLTVHVIPDTNFFFQYKECEELDWNTLFPDIHGLSEIHILIPMTVVSEIDQHKNSNNARLAKKARNRIPLLRELINNNRKITKSKNIKITIEVMKQYELVQSQESSLNPYFPDDKIVLEVINWKANNKDKNYCLLSGDFGLLMKCANNSVNHKELPEEWRLPPATDDSEKVINNLKKQIYDLQNQLPVIEFTGNEKIDISIKKYQALSPEEIDDCLNYFKNTFPEVTDFPEDPSLKTTKENYSIKVHIPIFDIIHSQEKYIYPSKEQIKTYHEAYKNWEQDLIIWLKNVHNEFTNSLEIAEISFSLENTGNAPAKDLIVDIDVSKNIFILPPLSEDEEAPFSSKNSPWGLYALSCPQPPSAPKLIRLGIAHYQNIEIPKLPFNSFQNSAFAKKLNKFYWEPKRPKTPEQNWKFHCSEFRHLYEKEPFQITILIPENFEKGELNCKVAVSASNMPSPAKREIKIKPNYSSVDTNLSNRVKRGINILKQKIGKLDKI